MCGIRGEGRVSGWVKGREGGREGEWMDGRKGGKEGGRKGE